MKNKNKYYSTGIDEWWTQNPKSKWIITRQLIRNNIDNIIKN